MKEKTFHGLTARKNAQGELIFKDRNFTSSDFYSNTYMMSFFPKYWYFVTIGSRGRGKTYSGKNFGIKWVITQISSIIDDNKKGNIRKFMWWRLTNDAVGKVIENNGSTFFEKSLLEKYHIIINIVNQDILFARDDDYTIEVKWAEDEEKKKERVSAHDAKRILESLSGEIVPDSIEYNFIQVGKIASIQEYYKYKGNQLNDYDTIIMDELVRAESERRTFNIPKAFINMIENVCRKRKGVRVLIYANAIGEMQEVKQLFGFMPLPGHFGIYKIYHKRTIIEYLDDSEEWKQEQSQTMAGVLQSSSEFTNVHMDPMEDLEDFFIPRKLATGKSYFASIKIDRGLWLDIHILKSYYYIDTDTYTSIKMHHSTRYALDKTLVTAETIYSKEIIQFIKDMWSLSKFRFSSKICYEWFTKALERYNII